MFKRWLSGTWGVFSLAVLTALVVLVLSLMGMPAWLVWAAGLFMGCLLVLNLISAVRGSAKRPQEFSTFESNALGQPVTEEFQAPFDYELPFDPSESVLCQCAPIMQVMSGLGDLFKKGSWSFLGKGKTKDAENALVLTQRRLMFLMIGPDELKRFAANPRVSRLLETLPGDAGEKRRMLFNAGAVEVKEALSGLLAAHGLEQLQENLFSFSLPLERISSISHSPQKRVLDIQIGEQRQKYFFKYQEDLNSLAQQLAGLGLSQNLGVQD